MTKTPKPKYKPTFEKAKNYLKKWNNWDICHVKKLTVKLLNSIK